MPVFHIPAQILHGGGQFAHEQHEVLLHRQEVLLHESLLGCGAGKPDGRIEFVHGPAGFHPRMTLGHPPVVHQHGRPLVPGFGHDAHVRHYISTCRL